MAGFAQKLLEGNPGIGNRVQVVHGKVESVALPEKADILISEAMGTLLVNERMLETYIYARDHMLKPGGKMFPSVGRIHVAAFMDAALYIEQQSMATFWENQAFYGVNLTALHQDAAAVRCAPVPCQPCHLHALSVAFMLLSLLRNTGMMQ
jgi:type I protein arginine methyltransferase